MKYLLKLLKGDSSRTCGDGRQEETTDVSDVLKSTSPQSFHLLQQGPQSSALDVFAGLLLPSSGWFWFTGRVGKTDKFRP